ncbi:MAG: phosphotransferase family protein [Gammaproteobacteria bacterium]|nr:phosphotransferase family protein [Gammaproteobacteria bacterium]MDE0272157.1 phosphotransferase family protein [Gammaproteobacteria bacterium]
MEGIDEEKVTAWLVERIGGLQPPLRFSLIAGGHSNLTYRFVDQAGAAYVLRRPPLGNVLESAHDMGREHRIIAALQGSEVPVAPALGLCADAAVNGAPFYVMGYVEGAVLHDTEVTKSVAEPDRHQLGLHVIEVLARLHGTDPDRVGLGDLGRKEAYLARQLKRWNRQWEASKTHEIPEMEETSRILAETMPEQVGAAIVHGDYRLGNMIVGDGAIRAVLDWELCTLGDPLADVGYLLNSWVQPEEVVTGPAPPIPPTAIGGFPSREAISELYERRTGRSLNAINYYRAFSHWRLAAIGQGVYKRYLVGAMGKQDGINLDTYRESVRSRAQSALALLA